MPGLGNNGESGQCSFHLVKITLVGDNAHQTPVTGLVSVGAHTFLGRSLQSVVDVTSQAVGSS